MTVTGSDDTLADGNQSVTIFTAAATGASAYAGVNPTDVTVTNTDDDATFTVSAISGNTTTPIATCAPITITGYLPSVLRHRMIRK